MWQNKFLKFLIKKSKIRDSPALQNGEEDSQADGSN